MDSTWSVISWSVPSFIPQDYPIIMYEIGYLSGNCPTLTDGDFYNKALNQYNVSSSSTLANITGLTHTSCYIFGVRAYTTNGYGKWTIITSETLALQVSGMIIFLVISTFISLPGERARNIKSNSMFFYLYMYILLVVVIANCR